MEEITSVLIHRDLHGPTRTDPEIFSPNILPVPERNPTSSCLYPKYSPINLQPAPNIVQFIHAYCNTKCQ